MPADVVTLIASTYLPNPGGDPVPTEVEREVMAERLSVRQSEFYQAAAAGFKPTAMFRVMSAEYHNERTLVHAGRRYTVIRTYDRPDERTELICEGMV
jgi:SPP1 family predicted phage head-tail adaptor